MKKYFAIAVLVLVMAGVAIAGEVTITPDGMDGYWIHDSSTGQRVHMISDGLGGYQYRDFATGRTGTIRADGLGGYRVHDNSRMKVKRLKRLGR